MGRYAQYSTIPIAVQALEDDGVTGKDISGGTDLTIVVQPANGSETPVTGTFLTDGTDGWVVITNDGYFDTYGKCKVQLFYKVTGIWFATVDPMIHDIIPSLGPPE